MENFEDIRGRANELAEELMGEGENVMAKALGLDVRAAHVLFVGDDWIAVGKSEDRNLQYYGGFEYVDKEHRTEIGDYVFYSAESDRVRGHLDRLEN